MAAANIAPKHSIEALIFEARASNRLLADLIVERGLMTAEALRDFMADVYGLGVADLGSMRIDPALMVRFPREAARRYLMLPISREGSKLTVAVTDPTQAEAIRSAHRIMGLTFDLRLATRAELAPLVEPSSAATLLARMPSGATLQIDIPDPGEIMIGRAAHNTLVLPDATLSATHAVIRANDGEYRIIDFGSRNGVFVNDVQIHEPHVLANGDVVRMGQCAVIFTMPGAAHAREDGASASPPDEEAEDPEEKAERKEAKQAIRMRAAWIAFASRIIAQAIGAAAMITLGLILGGGLPTSCSPAGDGAGTPPPAATKGK